MKGFDMKNGILSIIALVAATSASAGAPAAPLVTIKASGPGHWEILCHVGTGGGDETIRALEPGRDMLALSTIRYATCNYKNANQGPMTVSVESTAFACPFKVAEGAACATEYGRAYSGSFELKRKP